MSLEKDAKIANLEGQVEAYQEQMRSLSIQLLRDQVKRLQDQLDECRSSVMKISRDVGKLRGEVNERLDKAGALFATLRDQIKEVGDGKEQADIQRD